MAREDVYVPRFEPAAVDYNPDNIDRNFNEVRDTIERLRDSANAQSDETVSDLTALEGTVTTISEAVYEPTTGLAATRARLITEEGVRATADSALAARATTLEATVNDGTTGLVATRARLITEESTRATADTALASRATALEATVNDGTTGLVATRARLITEESTRATADTALASRATALEATVNDGTTGLVATRARLITEESTRATADTALASRATALEATVNDGTTGLVATRARLITEESTRASADSALASRATTLEARSYVKGNLVRGSRPYFDSNDQNSLFSRFNWDFRGSWGVGSSVYVDGPYLSHSLTAQTNFSWFALRTNPVPVVSGVPMSAQALLGKFGTWVNGTIGITIYWFSDAAGTTLVPGTPNSSIQNWENGLTVQGQTAAGETRWCRVENQIAPAGAVSARLGIYLASVTGNGVYTEAGAWMLKLEYGSTSTSWTDDAMVIDVDARIRVEETTRATADTALAARATTLEATVNDGTTGLVATRARLITEESTRASADSALASRATTLEAKTVADQQADFLPNGGFLRGTSGWTASGGLAVQPQTPEGVSGRNGVGLELTSASGVQYYETQFSWPTWRSVDLAWTGITTLWNGGSPAGASIRVYIQGRVGAGSWTTIANTAAFTDIISLSTPKTLRATGAAGWDTLRLLFEINPPTSGTALIFVLTQRVSNWTGEFPSLDMGPRALIGTEARIATEETVRATADTALAARATTLEATVNDGTTGLVATRARLITEESTRASADSALASSISTVSAKTDGRPNLFPVPTPSPNQTPAQLGWQGTALTTTNAPWVGGLVYYHVRPSGGSASTEFWFYDIPDLAVITNLDQYTLSAYGYGGLGTSGDRLQMYLEIRDSTNTSVIHVSPLVTLTSDDVRFSTTTTFSGAPTNCRIRVVFRRDYAASGSYQDTVFNMIKVENGLTATAFTNSAQVNVQAGAIATLNSSAAFYQILVAASGGDPAIIRLFSGLGGSEVAIAARVLSLINTSSGANMEVMRAVEGEAFFSRPLSVDFGGRRLTIGPGFGVSGSQVVLWFGPSTIAPASQSRTNGTFALGTDGIVYYGGDLIQTGSMQMTLSSYAVNLTRSGTGNTSTSVTATGFAPGTLSYTWALHSGDGVNIGSPSSATTTIGHTLTALGQTKTSVVKCTVTSSAGPTTFQLFNISSSEIS